MSGTREWRNDHRLAIAAPAATLLFAGLAAETMSALSAMGAGSDRRAR
jgi:hypothetical protein